jgi:DNA-binding transcriptional ArsR family regulator
VTAPAREDLAAAVEARYPGWRGWRTRGGYAARKAGTLPLRAHARGKTIAGLQRAIEAAIAHPSPAPIPPEQVSLEALRAASQPLSVRAISDATGLAYSTAQNALASLYGKKLVTRRRGERRYEYWLAPAKPPPRESGSQRSYAQGSRSCRLSISARRCASSSIPRALIRLRCAGWPRGGIAQ